MGAIIIMPLWEAVGGRETGRESGREGGEREEGRGKGGREGGRESGREGGEREEGRGKGGRKGGRKGGEKEGGRKGGREGGREGEKLSPMNIHASAITIKCSTNYMAMQFEFVIISYVCFLSSSVF